MRLSTLTEAFTPTTFQKLCGEVGFFISFNLAKIGQYATDPAGKTELESITKLGRQPAVNGMTFAEAYGDLKIMNSPVGRAALMKWIHGLLTFAEPRLKRFLNDEGKTLFLPRLEQIKKLYIDIAQSNQ